MFAINNKITMSSQFKLQTREILYYIFIIEHLRQDNYNTVRSELIPGKSLQNIKS